MSLFEELKRRNVIRVALGYLAAAWLLVQVVETVFPVFGLSNESVRWVIVLLAIGFVPALVATWAFEWTPAGIRRDSQATDPSARARSARRFDRIVMVLLGVALAWFAFDKFLLDPARDAAQREAARAEGRAEAVNEAFGDRSIAVLPFVNMSGDPEQEYFSDGITEELLNLLATLPELRVISRSTSFTFKGQNVSVPEAARKMNVAHVLEGSVRRSGDRVRITAQLIEAAGDRHLWSETYDRRLDDLFAVQDDIAAQVVDALAVNLVYRRRPDPPLDAATHDLFLRAHHEAERYRSQGVTTVEDWRRTIADLERVLEQAPAYPPAAWDYYHLNFHFPGGEALAGEEAAYREAARVFATGLIQANPGDSLANSIMAWQLMYGENDPVGAARHWEIASQADPYDLRAMRPIMRFLIDLGRHDEAVALAEYLLQHDPACYACVLAISSMQSLGRHREVAERLERLLQDWHPLQQSRWRWLLGRAWLLAGDPGRAAELFAGIDDGLRQVGLAMAYHDLGRIDESRRETRALEAEPTGRAEQIARVHAWTGNADVAFRWMEIAIVELGESEARSLFHSDLYRRLRDDPRWSAIVGPDPEPDTTRTSVAFNPTLPVTVEARIRNLRQAGAGGQRR